VARRKVLPDVRHPPGPYSRAGAPRRCSTSSRQCGLVRCS
jgi:hypothetical protein